ncbi:hypothetical protein HQQ94_05935 [Shewanella sp. VB17]|uniref:tectonin domain-containing protein n=1 Tax=Shewanella sp. VB17 TaxID=2739432 RepID=UPI0015638B93|nr:tectonin domain-containing protein [Shewanella sp. VB17]NRD72795.1 hypothetical protein [Shewanella sp. VB17]
MKKPILKSVSIIATLLGFSSFSQASVYQYYGENKQCDNCVLESSNYLANGQYLVSANKKFFVAMQGDGNFVIYKGSGPADNQGYIWASNTNRGAGDYFAAIQGDGKFALYNGTGPTDNRGTIWASNTTSTDAQRLVLLDDGQLVTLDKQGQKVWATKETTAGTDILLQVEDFTLPNGFSSVEVSGLPTGVTINGQAQLPTLGTDGYYTQTVDLDTLKNDKLTLNVVDGFLGSIHLEVKTVYQISSEIGVITGTHTVANPRYYIAPKLSGTNILLQVEDFSLPNNFRSVVVSGLPKGVTINGQALLPKLSKGGRYMQIVDLDALKNGKLFVNVPDGFFGDIDLQVKTVYQTSSEIGIITSTSTVATPHYSIAPKQADFLFAQSGSVDFSTVIENVVYASEDQRYWGLRNGVDGQNKQVYSRTQNSEWQLVDGMLTDIGVDKTGNVWGINANGQLFTRSGIEGNWLLVDDQLTSIAVQENGWVWGVKNNGAIYTRTSNVSEPWQSVPLDDSARDVAMGPNGSLWVIGYNGAYRKNNGAEWELFSSMPVIETLSVDSSGRAWVTNKFNKHQYVLSTSDRQFRLEKNRYRTIKSTYGFDKSVPVDIIVSPKIAADSTVTISGIPYDVRLLDSDNNVLSSGGTVSLTQTQVKGLIFDVSNSTADFYVGVELNSHYNGETVLVNQQVFINNTDIERTVSGTQFRMPGNRGDFTIKRIGNSLEISEKADTSKVTRLLMTSIDYLHFSDKLVSISDFYSRYKIPEAIDLNSGVVIVAGIPTGATVNNSIALGNGVYAIPAIDIQNGELFIDYSTIEQAKDFDIKIAMTTEASIETTFGTDVMKGARINGYANAKVYAEAGAEMSFNVGPDGVRAEARAYRKAGAVATVGGSFGVDGVATAEGDVNAGVYVEQEVAAQVTANSTETSLGVNTGVQATVSAEYQLSVEADFFPGTRYEKTETVALTAYANIGADGQVCYGDGCYGGSAEYVAEAGLMATATGYSSVSVGGVGANGEGGVEAGLGAGYGGGATAQYKDGELTIGASGKIAALIGVNADVNVVINTNETAEAGELVGSGLMSGAEAVNAGLLSMTTAINDYQVAVTHFIDEGVISVADAISQNLISPKDAVLGGLISVDQAMNTYGAAAGDFAGTAYESAANDIADWFEDCPIFC